MRDRLVAQHRGGQDESEAAEAVVPELRDRRAGPGEGERAFQAIDCFAVLAELPPAQSEAAQQAPLFGRVRQRACGLNGALEPRRAAARAVAPLHEQAQRPNRFV